MIPSVANTWDIREVFIERGQHGVRVASTSNLGTRLNYDTCAYDEGRPAPLIVDPYAAFATLFGLVGSPEEQAAFDQRGNLLGFALDDVKASLAAFGGNSAERAKLEAYLKSLEEGQLRQAQLLSMRDVTRQQVEAIVQQMAIPLENTPDPAGGTMLDNTVIVFIPDNGEQHHATSSEFPVVLIGGGNLGLSTGGRTIVYPGVETGGTAHRQISNLWATLGKLAGATPTQVGNTKVDFDMFGKEGPGRIAPGPLSELMK